MISIICDECEKDNLIEEIEELKERIKKLEQLLSGKTDV